MANSTPRMPDAARDLLLDWGGQVLLARHRAGMTQVSVAAAAGVSRVVIGRIERGKPVESWALALVMDALGVALARPETKKTPH